MSEVKLGDPVPDFTLPASDGKPFTLSAHRGKKVVLFFYPGDLTPTCTAEACAFRDAYAEFRRHRTIVAGVSPDPIPSHRKFVEKHDLPFLLLADEDQTVCRLFGVWQLKKMYGREYMGVVRSTFLIDENGVLAREWRKVRVKGHVETVLEAVKSI